MAGTISLSLSQQLDDEGRPLAGGKLYFYRAGTTSTPQNAFYDADLTDEFPNPYTLDAAGRIPQFFLADGSIKVVLIDRHGTTQISADNILVIGASSGEGGGGSVDPTTVLQTGMLAVWYGTGVRSGFVRANGRSIGSATSGATELAHSSAQALFLDLYDEDTNLAVSGGRGGLSAADAWAANKNIALPDWRGRAIAGLDDMGNSAAGRLTATYFGTAATVLGAAGGAESKAIVTANLPPYTPAGGVATTVAARNYSATAGVNDTSRVSLANNQGADAGTFAGASAFTGTAQGGISTPVAIASPIKLATIYIKL